MGAVQTSAEQPHLRGWRHTTTSSVGACMQDDSGSWQGGSWQGAHLASLEQRRSQHDPELTPEGPQLGLLVSLQAPKLLQPAGCRCQCQGHSHKHWHRQCLWQGARKTMRFACCGAEREHRTCGAPSCSRAPRVRCRHPPPRRQSCTGSWSGPAPQTPGQPYTPVAPYTLAEALPDPADTAQMGGRASLQLAGY